MILLRAAQEKNIKGSQSLGGSVGLCHTNITDSENIIAIPEDGMLQDQSSAGKFYAAVDIGTTTLSIEVYDSDGNYIGGCAENNAQGRLGSDVMMRLMHVSEGRQKILHQLIRDQIHQKLQQILTETMDLSPVVDDRDVLQQLQKISVVGNTVMCHLFLDKDTTGLRGSPFQTDYQGSYQLTGKDLEWYDCPDVRITVLPGIASHVGADAAAVFWAEQLWQKDKIQLAVDLGTNAEILLNNRGKVYVCSAAAGPAFEGKGIACGCRGVAGAISGVRMNRTNGNIVLDVLPEVETGKLQPRGLCGSGLIDSIAALLGQRVLQQDGYLLSAQEAGEQGVCEAFVKRLRDVDGDRQFVIYDPDVDKTAETDTTQLSSIYITQQDIRHFQLAKGAIQTGIALLCRQDHLDISQIEDCRVAGVFGTFLSLESAKCSGLLPDLPSQNIHFVGNSAGKGAAQSLFDPEMVPQLENLVKTICHIELAEEKNFQSQFLENMALCAWKTEQKQ